MDELCKGGSVAQALNAAVLGNGDTTLVLSHGYGSDQNVWHYLVPHLACFFKVVVFDLVISPKVDPTLYDSKRYSGNFGAYADDLLCLLDELGVNKAIYLGHSMSAMIGCVAAVKKPHLFEKLVLLGGSPRYLNAKGYEGGFEKSEVDTIFNQIEQNFSSWVHKFAPQAVGPNSPSTAITEFERSLGGMKPEIALSAAKTVFLSDLRDILPKVTAPCTLLQSQRDRVVPVSVAYYTKEKLGSSRVGLEILETEGHFPQLTAYGLLLDVLKRVLHVHVKGEWCS